MDTRGVIHMLTGNTADAIRDITASIAQKPIPERYFHLAQAQHKAGNSFEAIREMRKARDKDLSKQRNLHRLEWKSYDEMMGLLGTR